MKPINILIIDDQILFRGGVKLALQQHEGFEVVGEAGDGLEGVKLAKQFNPDVALLQMSGAGALGILRVLKEGIPETRVVMLAASEDTEGMLNALRAGACGYLLKDIDNKSLLESIRRAARGESVVSPKMMRKLADSLRANHSVKTVETNVNLGKLTPREKEIIVMIARGSGNKEIALTLNLAENTIKRHTQAIFRKLNLTKRVQVAMYAMENGFLSEELPTLTQIIH